MHGHPRFLLSILRFGSEEGPRRTRDDPRRRGVLVAMVVDMPRPRPFRATLLPFAALLVACNGVAREAEPSATPRATAGLAASVAAVANASASAEARAVDSAVAHPVAPAVACDTPSSYDVLATVKELGYEGAGVTRAGDCLTLNAETPDHRHAQVLIGPCNNEQAAPGWATLTTRENVIVAVLVARGGTPDADATRRLVAAVAEGVGKNGRPIEVRPAQAPAWHLTRFKMFDNLKPVLAAQGFTHIDGNSDMASDGTGSVSAFANDGGKWTELYVGCVREGGTVRIPVDQPGSAYYTDGRCQMVATVLTKKPTLVEGTTGTPLPADARKVLESALAWK